MKKQTDSSPLPLTEKERSVLKFIEEHWITNGTSPSFQEIRDHFGFASYNSVQNYVKQLTQKNYVESSAPNSKRSLRLRSSSEVLQQKAGSLRESLLKNREEILSLPLLGRVAAGVPIEAHDYDEFLDVPPSMVKYPARTFALKVEGSSMIEDGIFDGDIVLVQMQGNASDGEIVVAVVDHEATLKRIYRKNEKKDGKIELRPSNSKMKSLFFEASRVNITGVVIGLIRKFN